MLSLAERFGGTDAKFGLYVAQTMTRMLARPTDYDQPIRVLRGRLSQHRRPAGSNNPLSPRSTARRMCQVGVTSEPAVRLAVTFVFHPIGARGRGCFTGAGHSSRCPETQSGFRRAIGAGVLVPTALARHCKTRGSEFEKRPICDVRRHDLRHSFASFAVADGQSLFMIAKPSGHKQSGPRNGTRI